VFHLGAAFLLRCCAFASLLARRRQNFSAKNIGWEYIEVLCALQEMKYLQENEQKRKKNLA
jgi:hypothetical protein